MYPSVLIIGLPVPQGTWDERALEAWLYDAVRSDVGAHTTDAELLALADSSAAVAEAAQVPIARNVRDYLHQLRARMRGKEPV